MGSHAYPPKPRLIPLLRRTLLSRFSRRILLRRTGAAATAFLLLLMVQGELLAQQVPSYGQPQQSPYPTYNQTAYPPNQPGYPSQQYPQQQYPQQQYPQQAYPQSGDQSGYPAASQPGYPPAQQGLGAPQLEQLLAPIALYPDTLVAQILTAATYPSQVADADQWRSAQAATDPFDLAVSADAQPWDPSIKGLTAFPQVLAMMDQNLPWTTALGAAYYNQPQDVLQAVQVLRRRAQTAGNLQSGPQEQVSYDQGSIVLAPANPQVIYVPAYNPWNVYGAPLAPYPGFSLLGALGSFFGSALSAGLGGGLGGGFGASPISFGLGIAMAAFTHMPWGWLGWGLSWLAHSVLFHQSTYFTHSTMVADWGLPHGGARAFAGFRDYRGAPVNFRTPGGYRAGNDYRSASARPPASFGNREAYGNNQDFARNSGYPGLRPGEAYRPSGSAYGSSFANNNARPGENYTRPSPSYASRPGEGFGGRPGSGYAGSPSNRSAEPNFARNEPNFARNEPNFARSSEPGFARNEAPRANGFTGRGYEPSGREEHFKAPKAFNPGKAPKGFGKAAKAPKAPKGGGHGGGKHHF